MISFFFLKVVRFCHSGYNNDTTKLLGDDMKNKIYTAEEIKERLYPVFINYPVYKAVLFGSYAKGIATEKSDVDIVIDSKGELLNIAFYGVLEDITTALDKKIDLLEISELKRNNGILDFINEEGYVLYEQ